MVVGITDPFQNRAGGVPPVHLLEGCVERMFVRHVRFAKAKNRVANSGLEKHELQQFRW